MEDLNLQGFIPTGFRGQRGYHFANLPQVSREGFEPTTIAF